MKALIPTHLKAAEYARGHWRVVVPLDIEQLDALKPEYWAHVANIVKVGDKIELFAEDGSWYVETIALYVAKATVKLGAISGAVFSTELPKGFVTEDFEIKWSGPRALWRVIRLKDKSVVHTGAATREIAAAWLNDYQRALAA
jgi:hypothetical protein